MTDIGQLVRSGTIIQINIASSWQSMQTLNEASCVMINLDQQNQETLKTLPKNSKKCSQCGIIKTPAQFAKGRLNKRRSYCKACDYKNYQIRAAKKIKN
jgi:hypothetical protein